MGAEAAAPNRFAELSTLVATAPSARKTGLSSMIRVSSTVRSAAAGSKPGVISGTRTGAATNASAPRTASARSIRFVTVDATRHARAVAPVARSPERIGIRADPSAPAATSWNIASGMRNAA